MVKKTRKYGPKIVAALSYVALNNLDRVNINLMDSGNIQVLKEGSGSRAFQG